jgi:hypothetical protein
VGTAVYQYETVGVTRSCSVSVKGVSVRSQIVSNVLPILRILPPPPPPGFQHGFGLKGAALQFSLVHCSGARSGLLSRLATCNTVSYFRREEEGNTRKCPSI